MIKAIKIPKKYWTTSFTLFPKFYCDKRYQYITSKDKNNNQK